jgi:heme exporter protein A
LQLSVRRLSKAYGWVWAIKDLSLELQPGDCVALLGPNGAGKTTFLKLVAGLIYPTSGEIQLNGVPFSRGSTDQRADIGFLTPSEHLYEHLRVGENLEFFTRLYRKDLSSGVLEAVLEEVNLKRWSREYVSALSSGMKCRLSIAKWKLLNPGLLLLDEPYGVLDGSGVDLMEDFLRRHCHSGNVVVLASHHIGRVLQLCTRAVILDQGKLTFDEPRQERWESFERAFGEFLPRSTQ